MCLAIPGPFAALAPFWAIPTETLPRNVFGPVIGLVNALGNTGGFAGPYIVGWLKTGISQHRDSVQRPGNRNVGRRRAGVFAAEKREPVQIDDAQHLNQFGDDFFRAEFCN